jgi:gliding motility-associated-like protein
VKIKFLFFLIPVLFFAGGVDAQNVSLYQQFNGRYDFTFIGNTLNPAENNLTPDCAIFTTSSADLALDSDNIIEKAYLYWAGSGPGDFAVKLNGQDIVPERTFNLTQITSGLIFFAAFKDVTDQVLATGNGDYTLSELDLTALIPDYCTNRTNFAGWAIIIVYRNDALPLNQLNVYDGLDYVAQGHEEIVMTLDNLNVIDNEGSRIGFLAWEGDVNLGVTEKLLINDLEISNPPLNPAGNAFNGTNSFTGTNNLYNMDLDVYDVQDFIDIGDVSAEIKLTSGQDFVMINAIVTNFNSQLPDATIVLDNLARECDSRSMTAYYTVYNVNATDSLPGGTLIAVYADGILVGTGLTEAEIPVGGSEPGQIQFEIPAGIPNDFQLTFAVDDNGTGTGIVTELVENNNQFVTGTTLLVSPLFNPLPSLASCNQGFGRAQFDFSSYENFVRVNPDDVVTFHTSQTDADNNLNAILNTSDYLAQATPQDIFVRITNANGCFSVTSFILMARNCPPTVYNYVSANNDGKNDVFFIKGLHDIFLNFQLSIYNRWGALLWEGNNNSEDWQGTVTKGIRLNGNIVPDGTYYYVLNLHDSGYPKPLVGFLYLNR